MVVGETEATVRSEMEGLVAGKRATWRVGTLQETTWTGEQLNYEPLHPAWEISLERPLARAFNTAYRQVYGHAPLSYDYWDFSTNAVAVVAKGIPVIGFGPGEHKLAHMRDEKCAVRPDQRSCAVTQMRSSICRAGFPGGGEQVLECWTGYPIRRCFIRQINHCEFRCG